MIERPTVFVLGAGAHCSYGFPSGESLKTECVVKAREMCREDDTDPLHLARRGAATPDEVTSRLCDQFAESLEGAGHASIDAFLNANRHQLGFDKIGKAAIAQVLLRYEHSARFESDDNWLKYLFRLMLDGADSTEKLLENKISFVTFNYDRFLESWMLHHIKHSFTTDDREALRILNQIPIVHVYGKLGKFPDVSQTPVDAWTEATTSIRTIFETEHDQSTIDQAKELLGGAFNIFFLGFGFHVENVALLELPKHVGTLKGGACASSYEINSIEWQRHMGPFSPATVLQIEHKCLAALRWFPIE